MPHNSDQRNKYYDFYALWSFMVIPVLPISIPNVTNSIEDGDFRNSLSVLPKSISKTIVFTISKIVFHMKIRWFCMKSTYILELIRIIRIKSVLNSYCCPNWVKWTPTNCIRCSVNGSYVGSRTLSRVPELVMLFRSFYLNIIYGQLTWCLFKCKINWPKIVFESKIVHFIWKTQ